MQQSGLCRWELDMGCQWWQMGWWWGMGGVEGSRVILRARCAAGIRFHTRTRKSVGWSRPFPVPDLHWSRWRPGIPTCWRCPFPPAATGTMSSQDSCEPRRRMASGGDPSSRCAASGRTAPGGSPEGFPVGHRWGRFAPLPGRRGWGMECTLKVEWLLVNDDLISCFQIDFEHDGLTPWRVWSIDRANTKSTI